MFVAKYHRNYDHFYESSFLFSKTNSGRLIFLTADLLCNVLRNAILYYEMFQVVLWFLLGSLVLVCFAEFINKGLNDSTRSNLPKSCPSINHNEHNTQFIWKNRLHQLTNCSEKDQKPPTWYEIVELNRNFRHCNHSTHHVFYPEGKPFLFRMRKDITESGIASDWVYFTKKEMYESDKYDTLKQNAYFDLNNKANRSETFFDEFFDMNLERNGSQKLAIFRNAVTNKYGLIVNLMDGCRSAVRNGGCYHMHHSKIYKYNAGGGDNPVYDSVISLTAGASGTWHFHMVKNECCNTLLQVVGNLQLVMIKL